VSKTFEQWAEMSEQLSKGLTITILTHRDKQLTPLVRAFFRRFEDSHTITVGSRNCLICGE
jgi:hypothetical protein